MNSNVGEAFSNYCGDVLSIWDDDTVEMKIIEGAIQNDSDGVLSPPKIERVEHLPEKKGVGEAFRRPPEFLGNRFVYAVISPRAHGLSIGINLNPDKFCNFDCAYCEVNRDIPGHENTIDLEVLTSELEDLLTFVHQKRLRQFPYFRSVPDDLLSLKSVALSGEGEPTRSPQFAQVVGEVMHVRSRGRFPFFKVVLITNSSGLDLPQVTEGLKLFTAHDEIWAKLEAGTQRYMDLVNRTETRLEKILSNILLIGRQRPITIQSMFPLLSGKEPPPEEIEIYVGHLKKLKEDGAQISKVQVYSAHRPAHRLECGHLPLKSLSRIAQYIRRETGIPAEVF